MNIPHVFDNALATAHLALVAQQVFKEGEFLLGKGNFLVVFMHLVRVHVERDGAEHEPLGRRGHGPQLHFNALQQLRKMERLFDVVVGTGLQAGHGISHGVFGREEDKGRHELPGAQLLAYFQAREAGQHPVHEQQVVGLGLGLGEAVGAVVGHIYYKSFFFKPLLQEAGNTGFVFDE